LTTNPICFFSQDDTQTAACCRQGRGAPSDSTADDHEVNRQFSRSFRALRSRGRGRGGLGLRSRDARDCQGGGNGEAKAFEEGASSRRLQDVHGERVAGGGGETRWESRNVALPDGIWPTKVRYVGCEISWMTKVRDAEIGRTNFLRQTVVKQSQHSHFLRRLARALHPFRPSNPGNGFRGTSTAEEERDEEIRIGGER
jgi:hypothetical protein